MADMLWQWILNEIVSLQQKSSLWNTQGAFCIFLFFCAISIDDRLNLFHQSIIIVLIINPAEHRITYNITICITMLYLFFHINQPVGNHACIFDYD